ncbi:RNA polymerase sigma factor [Gemmatimonas sp.]|uniref:RNA polymerase sigma factor n=1 Tax=Gemmatimonas sp. TaxID=1962908 RepID=UPI0035617724
MGGPDVARFAQSLTRNESAADDLVQETFLPAYRGCASFQQGSDAHRWLFSICHHAFLLLQECDQRMVLSNDSGDAERWAR